MEDNMELVDYIESDIVHCHPRAWELEKSVCPPAASTVTSAQGRYKVAGTLFMNIN